MPGTRRVEGTRRGTGGHEMTAVSSEGASHPRTFRDRKIKRVTYELIYGVLNIIAATLDKGITKCP